MKKVIKHIWKYLTFVKKVIKNFFNTPTFSGVTDLVCGSIEKMGKRDNWTREEIDKAKLDIMIDQYNLLQSFKPFGIGIKYLDKKEVMEQYDEKRKQQYNQNN